MTKREKWLISVAGGAAAFVAGVAGFQEGVAAWDRWHLPRPVMTPEIWKIAEQQKVTTLDVLELQVKSARDAQTELQIIKSQYELDGKTVPDYVTEQLAEKAMEINNYTTEILLIKQQAE